MAALTAARDTPEMAHPTSLVTERGIAGSTQCYAGGIACLNASGYVVPGATSTTLKTVGRFEKSALGTTNGAVTVPIRIGVFRFNNSSAGDAITIADVDTVCFVVDDQTVAKTNGTSTRSAAGTVFDVDATGVWVLMGISD